MIHLQLIMLEIWHELNRDVFHGSQINKEIYKQSGYISVKKAGGHPRIFLSFFFIWLQV